MILSARVEVTNRLDTVISGHMHQKGSLTTPRLLYSLLEAKPHRGGPRVS